MRVTTADAPAPPPRRRWVYLRYFVIAALVGVLAYEIWKFWPHLAESWETLGKVEWQWSLLVLALALLSMDGFARMQRMLLRAGGVNFTQASSASLTYASNAVGQTLPGGPVLAPTMVYRRARQLGATSVVAGWLIVMCGVLSSLAVAVLALVGITLTGAVKNPVGVVVPIAFAIAFIAMAQYIAARPEALRSVGAALLRWVNKLRGKPETAGTARLNEAIEQLGAVRLSTSDGARAFGYGMVNMTADAACLGAACYAVGGSPSVAAVAATFAVSKTAASFSPIPGGVLVVEAILAQGLQSAGMSAADAVAAAILYRACRFVFVVAVGWIVFALFFRKKLSEPITGKLLLPTPGRGAGPEAGPGPGSMPGPNSGVDPGSRAADHRRAEPFSPE